MKSVTILLTTKNDERTIKKCVDSLLDQTYKNRKIYVTVATSSTDKTYDILKQYGKKIILERVTGNRPASYNKMMKKINTDYVAFTDGDAVCDKNWLKELVYSFKPGIVAVGGMIKNPKTDNKLQYLIGKELEDRFSRLPKYVARLPTMNLCVRTEEAKSEKFDESLRVAQETDWGYRLNKYGRTRFNKKAIVWHYHRATWRNYFKQQYLYGQNVPRVYLKKEHLKHVAGDEISTTRMVIELLCTLFAFTFLLLGLSAGILIFIYAGFGIISSSPNFLNYSKYFYMPIASIFVGEAAFLFEIVLLSFAQRAWVLSKDFTEFCYFTTIFLIRSIAWTFGILSGLVKK